MTREEFDIKYGDVVVTFSNYYKYVFTYAGIVDGVDVIVSVGGDADEIYRKEVANNESYKIKDMFYYYASAYKDKKLIEEFYE